MSRKNIFIENLIKNRSEKQEEIIFFSQNTKKIFENRIFSEKENIIILENLIKYLPLSRKIIDEYLMERYGYPNSDDGILFNQVKDLINKENKIYRKLIEEIFNDSSTKISKNYDKEIGEFNKLSNEFKEALELEKRSKYLLKNCENLRLENLSLEEIDKEEIKKETQRLNNIKILLSDSEKVIQNLKKLI
jgi:hypothetical protein